MKKKEVSKVITEKNLISNKAYFFQRLIAYILDMFIVTLIVSLLSQPFIDLKTMNKLQEEESKVVEKYMKGDIKPETYVYQSMDINYQIARNNGAYSLISMAVIILYFVVYQFYNKGQTIGKKIMNIQIVKDDRTSLSIDDLIYRSLIINSLIFNLLTFALMTFASRTAYFYGAIILEVIQYIILIAIFFMAIFRKDGRGLHDLVAKTIVVKKEILKEEECNA